MPTNIVKTTHDEKMWERAKSIVGERLGKGKLKNVRKGSTRYWKLVMFLFKRLKGKKT